jgi:hypothetical protein
MQDWLAEHLTDEGPSIVGAGPQTDVGAAADDDAGETLHQLHVDVAAGTDIPDSQLLSVTDLDEPTDTTATPAAPSDVNAGAKRTLVWLGSGVALTAAAIVLAFLVFGGGPAPAPAPAPHHSPVAAPAVVAVPTPSEQPAPPQDQAVPFDPSTISCLGGPTSPLALTDITNDSAWVCSRGPQESRIDGQILHVKFLCDRSRPESACSYIFNSLSVTPGCVPKTPGGKDEWLEHRVPKILQFNFYNGDQLAADPFFLDTKSVHGQVPATLSGKILASRVDVMILHTERPTPGPATGARGAGPDGVLPPSSGLLDSVEASGDLPPPVLFDTAPGQLANDPVDATFCMSQLQFFGHSPN